MTPIDRVVYTPVDVHADSFIYTGTVSRPCPPLARKRASAYRCVYKHELLRAIRSIRMEN